MELECLRVNRMKEPIGICTDAPTFSFKVNGDGSGCIKSITVDISTDEDFGDVIYSFTSTALIPSGFSLPYSFLGGIRYFWRVTVENTIGEIASSQSFFECGRKNRIWDIPFITTREDSRKSVAFYRKFRIGKTDNARLYITALGLYEAYIDGRKVGDEYFTPFCDDYRYILQYQTYDISENLKVGENEIVVLCGNGWYGGRHPSGENEDGMFGNGFLLSAEIVVDGERIAVTDESWLSIATPIVFSEIYDGEIYDSRREIFADSGKVKPDVTTFGEKALSTNNPQAKIIERISPKICVRENYIPSLIITPSGGTVLDFGREITGWAEFEAYIPCGGEVKLSYGEILQNGEFYRDNLRTAKAEFIAVGDGRTRKFRPHFTFFGFRYVKVDGLNLTSEDVNKFIGKAIYSDLPIGGKIISSNEKLNRFIENVFQSQKDNFLDIPLDCPQRDERFGWTGDAQVFCETALYNADCIAFYDKYLRDMREEQIRYGGACPFIVPDAFYAREELKEGVKPVGDGEFMLNRVSAGWGDAAVIIPWNLYRFTGDEKALNKNYVNMKLWTEFLYRTDENHGGRRVRDYGFGFGDWLALDNTDKDDKRGKTDTGFIATAYYYNAARLTARAADIIGETADKVKYEKLAGEIFDGLRSEYISDDGKIKSDTQTAYALAVVFGLCDKKIAGKHLYDKLSENGMKLSTGFVGTAFLLDALTSAGYIKEAFSLMLGEDIPGWLYSVNMGATTVWERWDSVLPGGNIRDGEMNSLNHYAYGSVLSWVYKSIVGIRPDETAGGFDRAVIAPVLDKRLDKVYGEYDSVVGKYAVGYAISGAETHMKIIIPYLGEAKFVTPDGYKVKTVDGQVSGYENIILKGGTHSIILV